MKLEDANYNVVGDVTGYKKTFEALIAQMPKVPFIGLGDLIDRGSDSKGVLDIFIDNGWISLMGNHEHMMLFEKIKNDTGVSRGLYPSDCWYRNGGVATLRSFDLNVAKWRIDQIPAKYWDYIANMPLRLEVGDKFVLTHAPISNRHAKNEFLLNEINKNEYLLDHSALWNRSCPFRLKDKVQLYGHNSTKGILWHTTIFPIGTYKDRVPEGFGDIWAICLDTWREGYLSGLHLPTMEIYKQPIVD